MFGDNHQKTNRPFRPIAAIGVFLWALILSQSALAQVANKPIVIRNVRIFDGQQVIPEGSVVIQGDTVAACGLLSTLPENAETIDGQGKTLLPGLIDSHVHLWDRQNLRQCLVFGVTTVVDMFMAVPLMTQIKQEQSSGKVHDMARLYSSGTLATSPKGHGTEYGMDIPTISKAEDAQKFVDDRIAEGSDFIKIILDDGKTFSINWPTFDKVTLAALIQAAHNRNKKAVVHISTWQAARTAIEAGADGLAHLFGDDVSDPDFGRFVAGHRAFVIPTFSVLESLSGGSGGSTLIEDPCLGPFLSTSDIMGLRQSFPFSTAGGGRGFQAAQKALALLNQEGVPIVAGTDSPNPGTAYGASLHRELELLVQAGMTPVQALRSATATPAAVFPLSDCGRIRPGFHADLLLVNGDPTQDIRATRDIAAVWKDGIRVDRDAYRTTVEKEKQAAERQKNALPPPGLESGVVSDFEEEQISARFGIGWSVSTDAIMGGKSKADIRRVEGGSEGSQGALLITGLVAEGSPNPWAGAFFSPGLSYMSPSNLSSKKSVSFWVKGDEKTYYAMIFAKSLGWMPSIQTFTAGPEWKQLTFTFEKFNTDGHDITGLFIGGGAQLGDFSLTIDDVRLQ